MHKSSPNKEQASKEGDLQVIEEMDFLERENPGGTAGCPALAGHAEIRHFGTQCVQQGLVAFLCLT